MESSTQFQSASPSRQPRKPLRVSPAKAPQPARPQKLPKAAVEATADAFMALFTSLPSTVKWRIIQKMEAYEDEFDEQEFAAARAAADESPTSKQRIPFEQVMAEYETLHQVKLT